MRYVQCLSILLLGTLCLSAAGSTNSPASRWIATNFQRKTIYRSPQTPGYTCWVGAWAMPDESMMVTFKQVTGPIEGLKDKDKDYNYSGLDLANVYLRSTDGGVTWVKTAEDRFRGPSERPVWGGSHCALAGGGVIRAVDGSQMPSNDVPRRIFFQRSFDLGKTWGAPEIPPEPTRPIENFIGDFADCITRVRRLSDGRLVAMGGVRRDPNPAMRHIKEVLVMFSKDEGKTWSPLNIKLRADQKGYAVWNEWDSAQLPNGDFLCVFRRMESTVRSKQVRWQGLLQNRGDHWVIEDYRPAPFPHSGHPELLRTREGIVLHVATSGIDWTDDAGATWHRLDFKSLKTPYRSHYYPVSLQTKDGRIFVFAHVGGDNSYGKVNQSITMDCFRLIKE